MTTALVHLVWPPAGMGPFEAFVASYERTDPGREHDLVMLYNGVPDGASIDPYRRRLADLRVHEVVLAAPTLDIAAYRAAARVLAHDRLCFTNSYTTLMVPGWLAMLSATLDAGGVGVAGATGSWASQRSTALSMLRLPNGYGGSLGDVSALTPDSPSAETFAPRGRLRGHAKVAFDLSRQIAGFPGFPAPHVRSNAFVMERALLLSLRTGRLRTKYATYRFESGARGLTGQLHERGLQAVVVGRDGVASTFEAWPDRELFWQGTQRDLLVADNQTRAYEDADPQLRAALSRYAWGPRARPS